jgi:hypothetical protein
LSIEDKSKGFIQLSKSSQDYLGEIFSESRIIKTFSNGLNRNLGGGLHPGTLFTIEGAPDGSKSTFAQQLIEKAAEEFHYPGLFIISELSPLELYLKTISRLSRKSATLIDSKAWEADPEKYGALKSSLSDSNDSFMKYADCLYIDDYSKRVLTLEQIEKSVTTLREKIRREWNVTDDPPFMLFIESIQRIHLKTESGEPHALYIDRLTHDLKELARDHGIVIIALYDLPPFPMLYENQSLYFSSQSRNSLGDTAYSANIAAFIEMGDWLIEVAIKDFSQKGIDAFTQKLENAKKHFPLSNPKIRSFSPTYARILFSHKTAGITEELFFIYLQATNEFLEITL